MIEPNDVFRTTRSRWKRATPLKAEKYRGTVLVSSPDRRWLPRQPKHRAPCPRIPIDRQPYSAHEDATSVRRSVQFAFHSNTRRTASGPWRSRNGDKRRSRRIVESAEYSAAAPIWPRLGRTYYNYGPFILLRNVPFVRH